MRNERSSGSLLAAGTILTLAALMAPSWATGQRETVLHRFPSGRGDGYYPYAGLISDASGNLYGTTVYGGIYKGCYNSCGTVFQLVPKAGGGWTENVLHTFDDNGVDGLQPFGGLVFDKAGNLYGTTENGGAYGGGTIFELSPVEGGQWKEQILYNFASYTGDAISPVAGLVFDAYGNLYGTALGGGSSGFGAVFELYPNEDGSWSERVLYGFESNGTDGYEPYSGLVIDASTCLLVLPAPRAHPLRFLQRVGISVRADAASKPSDSTASQPAPARRQ